MKWPGVGVATQSGVEEIEEWVMSRAIALLSDHRLSGAYESL